MLAFYGTLTNVDMEIDFKNDAGSAAVFVGVHTLVCYERHTKV